MKRIMLIYNPIAGRGVFTQSVPAVVDIFVRNGYRVEVWPTQAPGDACVKVAEFGREADIIVAAGGDGTLDQAIEGMFMGGFRRPLGYIPVGSTNDFASTLKLESNAYKAARSIVKENVKELDVGVFGDNHFIYVAAFGAFTQASYKTAQDLKNALGHIAYVIEASRHLADLKPVRMTVHVNGETITDDFIYGMVSNSISVGGIKNITGKGVELDDGLFEVTLIRHPASIADLQNIVSSLLMDEPSNLVNSIKTDSIIFESETEVPWTLDGEYGGALTRCEIRVLRHALDLVMTGSAEA